MINQHENISAIIFKLGIMTHEKSEARLKPPRVVKIQNREGVNVNCWLNSRKIAMPFVYLWE